MISKKILAGAPLDDRNTFLVNMTKTGPEKQQMEKVASSDILIDLDIKPEKGHSYIHLISMGSGEYYSANCNGDYFNETSRQEVFPEAKGAKEITLDGGLKEYHKTYMEYGGVYKNHNNSKKGFKPSGEVVYETYNEPMHRGQLIIKVKDDLKDENGKFVWHDAIERLSRGLPVAFSQGCSVPYDICSICGNKAKTMPEHCSHVRRGPGGLLSFHEGGKQAYMINDKPYFHDISEVGVPADRIALALEKAASAESADNINMILDEETNFYIPVEVIEKLGGKSQADRYDLLTKLAKIEKELPMLGKDVVTSLTTSMHISDEEEEEVVRKLKDIPQDILINILQSKDMMLTPKTFTIILLKKKPEEIPGFSSIYGLLPNVFSEILEHNNPTDFISDGSYVPKPALSLPYAEGRAEQLSGLLSLDPQATQERTIRVHLKGGKPMTKVAAEPTPEAGMIAKEYAKYQLSFLASDKNSDRKNLLTVASNYN